MENNTTTTATTVTNGETTAVNYEAEYKKAMANITSLNAEIEKQKKIKDDYAKENAEYKRKEVEKMSDEERKAKEFNDLVEAKNKIEAELKTIKLKNEIMENGFTTEECEKLIKGNFAVKDIAEILKERVSQAEKSIKAGNIKNGTPDAPMGDKTSGAKEKTDYQKYQESKTVEVKEVKL